MEQDQLGQEMKFKLMHSIAGVKIDPLSFLAGTAANPNRYYVRFANKTYQTQHSNREKFTK